VVSSHEIFLSLEVHRANASVGAHPA
jgi:hypothetical protein